MISRILRGGECPEQGRIHHLQAASGWALAMSKGLDSPAPKHDPNEDACGVLGAEGGGGAVVAVVADAHFGRVSAEVVVEYLLQAAQQTPLAPGLGAERAWAWLEGSLEAANRRIRGLKTSSACAVLAVIQQGEALWWASVGDCRLYHVTAEGVQVRNQLSGLYLGDHAGVAADIGACRLSAGDRVVLASDGLPECRYGQETLSPEAIAARVRSVEPEAGALALVEEALRQGGEDNVAVVVGRL